MYAPNAQQVLTNQLSITPDISAGATVGLESHLSDQSTAKADGPSRRDSSPNRRCVATGDIRGKDQLLRFVLSPDKELTFDVRHKLPGRGMWLTPSVKAFTIARKKTSFSRAAKQQILIPAGFETKVANILREHTLALLGLARRRGAIELGTAKVEKALEAKELSALWFATDISSETLKQWEKKSQHPLAQVIFFTRGELAKALGRAQVTVIGLKRLSTKKTRKIQGDANDPPKPAAPALGQGWSELSTTLQNLMNVSDFLTPPKQEYDATGID